MDDIGNNLKRIRLLNNLSLEQAGKLLKMSAPAVAKYEKGQIKPDSSKLIYFANAYNVKVLDIVKTYEKVELKFDMFRKKQILSGKKLELLKETINRKVSDYIEVLELNDIKSLNYTFDSIKCNNYDDAEKAANTFREKYQLSINQPITDLISILENLGIIIIQIDNYNNIFDGFDGLCEIVKGIPCIIILKQNDGARQRFTIAHELGHLYLKIINENLDSEKICNRFASSLLMPKQAIYNEFGMERSRISFYELLAFKKEYKVSMQAIIYRLKDLNIISDYLYRKINIQFNTMGIKKQEPLNIEPEESLQYRKIVHKLEIDNIISLNKACELLGTTSDEYFKEDNNYRY